MNWKTKLKQGANWGKAMKTKLTNMLRRKERKKELWPYERLFLSLLQLAIRSPLSVFSVVLPVQALRRLPCLGSFYVV